MPAENADLDSKPLQIRAYILGRHEGMSKRENIMTTIFDNAVPAMSTEEHLAKIPDGAFVFGNLLKFGKMLVNPADVVMIDFEPADGCGCEIGMRGGNEAPWHVSEESAQALAAVLASSTQGR